MQHCVEVNICVRLCCRHRCVQITIGVASNVQSPYETPGPLGHEPLETVSVLAVLCRPPTKIAQVNHFLVHMICFEVSIVQRQCGLLFGIPCAVHVMCVNFHRLSANVSMCGCVQDYVPCSASLLHVPLKGTSVSAALRLPSDLVSGRNLPVIFIVAREY